MLKFETAIKKLAQMKASSYLSGSYPQIGTEIAMVAMIYGKKQQTVVKAIETVYPKEFKKLAGVA